MANKNLQLTILQESGQFAPAALDWGKDVFLSLTLVDELIGARKTLHGGNAGAPRRLVDGQSEGSALNRACVVMLSATLQAFVGDVFFVCSERAFGRKMTEAEAKVYRATWNRWGNPSDQNVAALFLRLGIVDVFDGLSWQGQSTSALKRNLDKINQVRNHISHGGVLKVDGKPYALRLSNITRWRNIAEQFGSRFKRHALSNIR